MSNYTGNPNATQAPASPPVDRAVPVVALPADGDPANAASVAQAFKVPADYLAFNQAPFAEGGQPAQEILPFKTAIGHRRSGVDHLGQPGGNYLQWLEQWLDVAFELKNSLGNGPWAGNWFYSLAGPFAGQVTSAVAGGGGTGLVGGGLFLQCSGSGATTNSSHAEAAAGLPMGVDSDTFVDWSANCTNHANAEFDMGFYDTSPTLLGSAAVFSTLTQVGAAFVRRNGDTNWKAYTRALGAGSATLTDTGVAFSSGSAARFRIELRGSNESDDAVARVIFYVNGAVVANVATDLGGIGGMSPFFRVSDLGTSSISVPYLRSGYNPWPGNIFL